MKRALAALAVGALLITLALAAGDTLRARGTDSLPPLDARALNVEKQLLCPQCTNKRLDTCEIEICQDMRKEIRARLERGEDDQAVVGFFASRYGDRILASLPTSGFPLWLWGWVAASVLLVGAAGVAWLRRNRRPVPLPVAPLEGADERWLDAQLDEQARAPGR